MRFRELLRPRYGGATIATLSGILDRLRVEDHPLELHPSDRLDGKTCLVTGANRGLGLSVAIALAKRGGHVLLACRSGIPEVMDVVRRGAEGAGTVEAVRLDLSSLDSVERLAMELAEDGVSLDVTILNAGIVPSQARRTRDGFDESFQVNFLANVLLVRRLMERGVISIEDANLIDEDANDDAKMMPRIVFVSSQAHRSAPNLDFESLGVFRPWSMRAAMREYAYSKLLTETWTTELARRTEGEISVHSMCPGAVDTDLAREAPAWAKPALRATMRAFFKAPEVAATPIVYLAAAGALEGETGLYFHVHQQKSRDPRAEDAQAGKRLWDKTEQLLRDAGHATDHDHG